MSEGERVPDLDAQRLKRELAIEATRPLAEALKADNGRVIVPPQLMVTRPGIYDKMPNDIYHADPVEGGSISNSGARQLLPPSCPALYKWNRQHPPERSDVFDVGVAAHHLVLGIGPEIVEIESPTWQYKAAQILRERYRKAGVVPLLTDKYLMVQDMATAIRQEPLAAQLLDPDQGGKPEQSMFWQQPLHWEGRDERMHETVLWRRDRLDWLPLKPDRGRRMILPEYKTADSADGTKFAKSAGNYGYHMQAATHAESVRQLLGVEEVVVAFIVQSKKPPYPVNVVQLRPQAIELGEYLNLRAMEIFAECKRTGDWPGYPAPEQVDLPGYIYQQQNLIAGL